MIWTNLSLSCTNLFVFVHENQKMHPLRQKVHRCLERNIYFCFVKIIRSNTQKEQLHEKELYL